MNSINWYQTFFSGLAIPFWQRAIPPSVTETEIEFVLRQANLVANSAILDVPSGAGRHSLMLAKRGYRVTSVDISEDNIRDLITQAEALNLSITPRCVDALQSDLGGPYELVLCLGNSFSYFPYAGMRRFVQNIAAATAPGGRFIINTGVLAESILLHLKPGFEMETGDITVRVSNQYLPADSVLKTEYAFLQGEKTELKTSFHYVYTLAEITRLLQGAGFGLLSVFNGLDEQPYQLGDAQAYLVAQRR
ncbi:MAG: class I SAM-dependent methyltransferase [Cytophagaceae bacterium]|nr:class I SAM-dependent methyltransferase [Cytophagaceae bacterium]